MLALLLSSAVAAGQTLLACSTRLAQLRTLVSSGRYAEAYALSSSLDRTAVLPSSCQLDLPYARTANIVSLSDDTLSIELLEDANSARMELRAPTRGRSSPLTRRV
jgi:hypothetical protein